MSTGRKEKINMNYLIIVIVMLMVKVEVKKLWGIFVCFGKILYLCSRKFNQHLF